MISCFIKHKTINSAGAEKLNYWSQVSLRVFPALLTNHTIIGWKVRNKK